MNGSRTHFAMGLIGAMVVISSCRKDSANESEGPYTERIIYSESFDQQGQWSVTPEAFSPDTSLVAFDDGMLKLTFNPMTYGAAWVGCELEMPGIQEDSILSRLGFRITLDSGFFQRRTRWTGSTGSVVSQSELRLYFNDVEMMLPGPEYGGFSADSTFDPEAYKIEGREFELIADRGTRTFIVDGVERSLAEVYFNVNGMSNHPLSMTFKLGHLNELDPRIDHLFVDRIEIYTWTGERSN